MRCKQACLNAGGDFSRELAPLARIDPQLVLVFAACAYLENPAFLAALDAVFPNAHCVGCSTAGEISDAGVSNASAVVTAIHFDRPSFHVASAEHRGMSSSSDSGRAIGDALKRPGLHSIVVFGQGVDINGSALIEGIAGSVGPGVTVTGGLAADDGAFERTLTLLDGRVSDRQIAGLGFYGEALRISTGCFGGWEAFGAARKITRSAGNILYELDGEPALDLYKRYLGDYAKELPAAGLLYPFEMLDGSGSEVGLIRTILAVDEGERSLTLAGSLVADGHLRLMHATFEGLVSGAEQAAWIARNALPAGDGALVLLVSCVGRKLVMGDRVEEEIEAVADVCGRAATLAGFYSNGEISPLLPSPECKLHNQTMAVTCLWENV